MTTAIVPGSIAAIAAQNHRSIAETFASCTIIITIDVSGSMSNRDARDGHTRYQAACDELAALQARMPGKVAVVSFSESATFCPSGVPVFQGGGTNMIGALQFIHTADSIDDMAFFLISDGIPDDEGRTLEAARKFKNKIHTIYVGPEGGTGQDFLQRLAHLTGGQTATAAQAHQLTAKIETLLLHA